MSLAPIILFVYNRPWHTQQTVEALQKNELAAESDLFIFADGPKSDATEECIAKIAEVRKYIHTIEGFKSITIEESPENNGLANSVIAGVTKIINQFGKVIVVEDDIVTHPFFLRFMNDALTAFANNKQIFTAGGYHYNFKIPFWYREKTYLLPRVASWGWATWADRWNLADWNADHYASVINNQNEMERLSIGGKDLPEMLKKKLSGDIDSWAILWNYCMFTHNSYCLQPTRSLTTNTGFDNSGTNCGSTASSHSLPNYDGKYNFDFCQIKPNAIIIRRFNKMIDNKPFLLKRIIHSLKKIIVR